MTTYAPTTDEADEGEDEDGDEGSDDSPIDVSPIDDSPIDGTPIDEDEGSGDEPSGDEPSGTRATRCSSRGKKKECAKVRGCFYDRKKKRCGTSTTPATSTRPRRESA